MEMFNIFSIFLFIGNFSDFHYAVVTHVAASECVTVADLPV